MSAFVVSHETMNRVVHALTPDNMGAAASCENMDLLGARLYAMNIAAVNYRYGSPCGETAPLFRALRRFGYSKCELAKAVDCLLYQCAEGDIPQTFCDYRLLKEARDRLYGEIVNSLPEYDAAAWDAHEIVDNTTPEADANARLIAAAPDMLKALDAADTAFVCCNLCDLTPQARGALRDAWAMANRAMSLATGRPDRFAEANPQLSQ